jgi:hypothetical protein
MPFLKLHLLTIFLFLFIGATALSFAFSFPLYQGPDEQIHYATIQYHAESEEKSWPIIQDRNFPSGDNIAEFHLSEEVIQSAKASQFDEIKWQGENVSQFARASLLGPNEEAVVQNNHKRYIDIYPPNISTNTSYYYWVSSWLENKLAFLDIIERFFLLRFFSVLLYLGTILIVYQVARKIFTTPLKHVLFTALVALQPMLLATGVIVNIDIALILGATLFFLGALEVITTPTLKSHLLLVAGLLLAFLGKASGIAFAPVYILVYIFFFQKKYNLSYKKITRYTFYTGSTVFLVSFFLIPKSILVTFLNLGSSSKFSSPLDSILTYFDKTVGVDAFLRTHASYWGNFGWLDTKIHSPLLLLITLLELVAWVGIALYFFSKKDTSHLPDKKTILLSLGMIFFLQLAIRFYDWRVFDTVGKVVIGTPGRYFLPTLIPHFLILITGLGFLLTKNKTQFTILLKTLALGMILLCLYSVFNVIIPRYYL